MLYLFEQQYSMPGRKRLGYLLPPGATQRIQKFAQGTWSMNNKPEPQPTTVSVQALKGLIRCLDKPISIDQMTHACAKQASKSSWLAGTLFHGSRNLWPIHVICMTTDPNLEEPKCANFRYFS